MAETAEDMAKLYFKIDGLRKAQGYRCAFGPPRAQGHSQYRDMHALWPMWPSLSLICYPF
jgi:hypothetical protein